MTEKQSYLYSSPSGIKLIEGDKMPVKPYHPCEQLPDRGCPICAGYKLDLWAAKKENAVTVADQEKALNLMWRNDPNMHNPISFGDWKHAILKPDSIYGPFSLRYEIESKCGKFGFNTVICGKCFSDGNGCQEPVKVAILYDDTPEKETRIDKVSILLRMVETAYSLFQKDRVNLSFKFEPISNNDYENLMVDFLHDYNTLKQWTPEKEESQEALLDELVTDIFEIGKEAILEKFTITRK
jgi:hypothetical protein